MPPGQPSSYLPIFAEQAETLARLGATDAEIADFFVVTVRTIYNWKHTHPEFFHALKVGKNEANERVKRALFQRAVGFEHDAVKIFMPAGATAPVYAPYREYVPPDTTAGIFWMKNREPEEWRDKTPGDSADNPLHLKVDREELIGKLIGNRSATPAAEPES